MNILLLFEYTLASGDIKRLYYRYVAIYGSSSKNL